MKDYGAEDIEVFVVGLAAKVRLSQLGQLKVAKDFDKAGLDIALNLLVEFTNHAAIFDDHILLADLTSALVELYVDILIGHGQARLFFHFKKCSQRHQRFFLHEGGQRNSVRVHLALNRQSAVVDAEIIFAMALY